LAAVAADETGGVGAMVVTAAATGDDSDNRCRQNISFTLCRFE
jgi:hypothetical protein